MRAESKLCHAVAWFCMEFCLEFSRFGKERDSLFRVSECVFNSKANCIHQCHQEFELGVENVINEAFPTVD